VQNTVSTTVPTTCVSCNRAIVYIDGFNLFHGMREADLRHCYWLDVRRMAESLVPSPYRLVKTKYFTSRVRPIPGVSGWRAKKREKSRVRQAKYLDALGTLDAVEIEYGSFLPKKSECFNCQQLISSAEEKMTDVNIATAMLEDAFLGRCEMAVVVSGDSDLVPPIRAVRRNFPDRQVVVAFPPKRAKSNELKQAATRYVKIWEDTLRRCQMPQIVIHSNGTEFHCPERWMPSPSEESPETAQQKASQRGSAAQ